MFGEGGDVYDLCGKGRACVTWTSCSRAEKLRCMAGDRRGDVGGEDRCSSGEKQLSDEG